ncbi:MAG: rhomboid family intramembrane serine protease [archaeon]
MENRFYALKLVVVCVIVYVFQLTINGFTDLFLLNQSSYVQIWRFVTAIFLHADMLHILYNMFALALFGSILEALIGSRKFLIVFFATGIIANIIAVNFYDSSLGASGAIYGILGALIIIRPTMMVWAFGFPMPMFLAGVLWVAGGVLGVLMPSNVGDIAHLSGIFTGILFGFLYRKEYVRNNRVEKNPEIRIDEDSDRRWEDYHLR